MSPWLKPFADKPPDRLHRYLPSVIDPAYRPPIRFVSEFEIVRKILNVSLLGNDSLCL